MQLIIEKYEEERHTWSLFPALMPVDLCLTAVSMAEVGWGW